MKKYLSVITICLFNFAFLLATAPTKPSTIEAAKKIAFESLDTLMIQIVVVIISVIVGLGVTIKEIFAYFTAEKQQKAEHLANIVPVIVWCLCAGGVVALFLGIIMG